MHKTITTKQKQSRAKKQYIHTILVTSLVVLTFGFFGPHNAGNAQESDGEPIGSAESFESIDDVFGRIATSVPAFGGMYEEDGILYINMTEQNPTLQQTTIDAIAVEFGSEMVSGKDVVTRDVQYGYNQLREWYGLFIDVVFSIDGVTGTEIDEKNNRLIVGVTIEQDIAEIQSALKDFDIPKDAIEVEVTGPVQIDASLSDRIRPLVGGLRITMSSGGGCTLGPTSIRNGVWGFITNSHCTGTMGVNQGVVFSQGGLVIGTEALDPPFFQGGSCPSGRQCRYSDVSYVNKNTSTMTIGRTARPDPNDHSEPISWNGSDVFRIVGEKRFSTLQQTATKVGATTGRSSAIIERSCWNADVGPYVLLCQDGARYDSADGDSGSPVFQITNSPGTNDVLLLGIHWGRSGSMRYYSPIGRNNVKRSTELRGFVTAATSINPARRNWDHYYVWRGGSQSSNKAVWWSANHFIASFNEVKTVQFNSGGGSSGFADTAYIKFCRSLNQQGEPVDCFGEQFISNINDFGTTTVTYSTPIQFNPGQKYWFSVNSGSGNQKILLYYSNSGTSDYTEGCNKWQDGTLHNSCSIDLNATLEAWTT